MSDEIQFGEVEHAEPDVALRPDEDAHFCTQVIGELDPNELLIFVDLDVMRDMEAHAISNTRVELGGVMLGKQLLDSQGRPYVLITDSLRAEHYEATKGSFKFTHDTWSQITRQREDFHPDLEMVGWYHTHPGWSVFLSGMDLFICNHFFNRPLDVALVIDPCEQDRGWFQWDDGDPPATHRTAGFVLITGRYRQDELDYFARLYNKQPEINMDPRYSSTPGGGTTSVQLLDGRKSSMEFAVVGMLAMQFLLMMFLAWKMFAPPSESETIANLEKKIEKLEAAEQRSIRDDAYEEVLGAISRSQAGDATLVNQFVKLEAERRRNLANLEGQLALNDQLKNRRDQLEKDFKTADAKKLNLETQLTKTRGDLKTAEAELKTANKTIEENGLLGIAWWWTLVSGFGALAAGLLGAYALWGGAEPLVENRGDSMSSFQPEPPTADSAPPATEPTESSPPATDDDGLVFTDGDS